MRVLATLALFSLLTFSTGCATLFTGTSDTITFESEPSGARVLVDGLSIGRTPVTTSVKRPGLGGSKLVTMQLDGYEDMTFQLDSSFNVISVLNLTNLLGWGIDVVTGAIGKYDRRFYSMELDRDVAMNLNDLPRTAEGALIVPQLEEGETSLAIVDEAAGLQIVFKK